MRENVDTLVAVVVGVAGRMGVVTGHQEIKGTSALVVGVAR